MKRILPDTNFYGLLAKDPKRLEVVGNIKLKRELVIYGFRIIRNELRDVPKEIRVEGKNLRIDLLNLYDEVVGYNPVNSVLRMNTPRFIDYGKFRRMLRGEPDEFI